MWNNDTTCMDSDEFILPTRNYRTQTYYYTQTETLSNIKPSSDQTTIQFILVSAGFSQNS